MVVHFGSRENENEKWRLVQFFQKMSPLLIGICGGSGCGKTTLSSLLQRVDPTRIFCFSADQFYKSKCPSVSKADFLVTTDDPISFDSDELKRVLRKIREGSSFKLPSYEFSDCVRGQETEIQSSDYKIVIVDGIFLFQDSKLAQLFDLKIFMLSSQEDCIKRYSVRDVEERGSSAEEILHLLPFKFKGYKKFIEPFKREADFIIPTINVRNPENHGTVNLLKDWLKIKL